MKIVVIGGTGLIGSAVVKNLSAQGHEILAASPRTGVNALTGQGIAEALKGAAVVVDVSNAPSWEAAAVMDFFTTSTRNLLAEEARAGVKHHVALSIVGTHRLPNNPYFAAKIAQEKLIKASSIPYSIVQATQFFEFIHPIADFATKGNEVRLPTAGIQPIAAADVSAAVARVAAAAPLNGTIEIGGPEEFHMDDLIRQNLRIRNDPRQVVTDESAGYYGAPVEPKSLVPAKGAQLSTTRFTDWLTQSLAKEASIHTLPRSGTPATT